VALLIHKSLLFDEVTTGVGNTVVTARVMQRKGYLRVFCVHAPHAGNGDESRRLKVGMWWLEFSDFYTHILSLDAALAAPTPVIIMGDMNAKASGKTSFVGPSHFTSHLLADFCGQHSLDNATARFTKNQLRLTTFKGTKGRRAQLDCILVQNRWKSMVHDVYARDAPIPSDHRQVMVKTKLHLKKTPKNPIVCGHSTDWNLISKESTTRATFIHEVKAELATSNHGLEAMVGWHGWEHHTSTWDTMTNYSSFARAVRVSAGKTIPPKERIELPDAYSRETARGPIRTLYDLTRRDRLIEESYTEEATHQATHVLNDFVKLNITQPAKAWKLITQLTTPIGHVAHQPTKSSPDDIASHFKKVNGTARSRPTPVFSRRPTSGLVRSTPYSQKELHEAIQSLSSNKAVGEDGVAAEVLKIPEFFPILHQAANDYLKGTTPLEVLFTRLVMVPKKGDLSIVDNYRGIAIISLFLKLVNRLNINRLRALDPHIRHGQNGFRPMRGTSEHALALTILAERARLTGQDLVALFIDFSKAFDSVSHEALEAMLEAWCVPSNMIRCILQCYKHHKIKIPLPTGDVEYDVLTGVLQGDTCAPYLFVLLLDCVLDDSIQPLLGYPLVPTCDAFDLSHIRRPGLRPVQVNPDDFLTEMGFADDICLTCTKTSHAQQQLHLIQAKAREVGLEINVGPGKTEYIIVGNAVDSSICDIDGRTIEQVSVYKYLGTHPFDPQLCFEQRRRSAWIAIKKLEYVWKAVADRTVKLHFFQSLVSIVFTYGGVTWSSKMRDIVDTTYTKMLRHCLRDWYSDTWTLYDHGHIPHLSSILASKRVALVGHALRHEQLLGKVIQSTNLKRALKKGPTLTVLRQLQRDIPYEIEDWHLYAEDRQLWNKLSRDAGARREEQIYRRLAKARYHRWTSLPRLESRVFLLIAETSIKQHSFDLYPKTVIPRLRPLEHCERVNSFVHGKVTAD